MAFIGEKKLRRMPKYTVQSGDLKITVKAENKKLAAMDAIRKGKPKTLGILIGIRKKGESEQDETFMLSQKVLEDMGYNVLEPEKPSINDSKKE